MTEVQTQGFFISLVVGDGNILVCHDPDGPEQDILLDHAGDILGRPYECGCGRKHKVGSECRVTGMWRWDGRGTRRLVVSCDYGYSTLVVIVGGLFRFNIKGEYSAQISPEDLYTIQKQRKK